MAYYNQPNGAESAHRATVADLVREHFVLDRTQYVGPNLSLGSHVGAEPLEGQTQDAAYLMLELYPFAQTGQNQRGEDVGAAQSAVHDARNVFKQRGLPVDTETEAGQPFGLAMVFFYRGIEWAEAHISGVNTGTV